MNHPPSITVFTPTFNRAYCLHRVYLSLCDQTSKDFEWLIVDDGSSDNTMEMVANWISKAPFAIHYRRQVNSGKHVAINYGATLANGELFLMLDSDDTCESTSIERFIKHWQDIPPDCRKDFGAIACLCVDENGQIVGSKFPEAVTDSDFIQIIDRFRVTGEKWAAIRTCVLREYPFPVFTNEKFLPESLVWNRLSKKYRTRFFNEGLRHYIYSPDGLTALGARARISSPIGASAYYCEAFLIFKRFTLRARHGINFVRFSLHARRVPWLKASSSSSLIFVAMLIPPGILAYVRDRVLMNFRKNK